MNNSSEIAKRLAAVRDGMTLDVFVERLGAVGFSVTKPAVNDYEHPRPTGKRKKIPADYIAAVCKAFGVSPWWLLLDIGRRNDPPPDVDAYTKGAADALDPVLKATREAGHKAGLRMTAEGFHLAPPPADTS